MKSKWLVILGIVLILAAPPARAQYTTAPIQVQAELDDMIIMYDCYPGPDWGDMIVYVSYPEGIASYSCAIDGAVWRGAMLQRGGHSSVRRVR